MNGTAVEFTDNKYTIRNARKNNVYIFSTEEGAEETVHKITEFTSDSVKAVGDDDILIVAGYDRYGVMRKIKVADGHETDLADYENCASIKAFLWDSLDNMYPYDCKEIIK